MDKRNNDEFDIQHGSEKERPGDDFKKENGNKSNDSLNSIQAREADTTTASDKVINEDKDKSMGVHDRNSRDRQKGFRNKNGDSKTTKKKKKNWKKGIVILILAGLLITLSFTPLFTDIQNIWGGPVYPEEARFSIQRTIGISTDSEVDFNMKLVVPEDIPESDIQYIKDIDWDGAPSMEEKDGRDWKYWSGTLSSGESKTVEIVYKAETRTIDWGYSSDNIGNVDDIPDDVKETYSGNQWRLDEDRNNDGERDWMIQPDHPQIQNLAEDIVDGKENIYDKSRAIYDWINNNIDYEIGEETGLPKHAIWVLQSGTGDCDEQSYLYISLSRAIGIPSWVELGVLYDRVRNRWGGHGWIRQIAVDDEGTVGWINIDTVNNQFFSRGATRVTFWVDNGIDGNLDYYYHFFNHTSGGRVSVSENFQNIDMDTEGQVVLGNGELVPGFTFVGAIPAVLLSIYFYKVRINKGQHPKYIREEKRIKRR